MRCGHDPGKSSEFEFFLWVIEKFGSVVHGIDCIPFLRLKLMSLTSLFVADGFRKVKFSLVEIAFDERVLW